MSNEESSYESVKVWLLLHRVLSLLCTLDSLGWKTLSKCEDEKFQQPRKVSFKNMWEIGKQIFEFQHRQFKAKITERKKAICAI